MSVRRCSECNEEFQRADISLCTICGGNILVVQSIQNTQDIESSMTRIRNGIRDLYGDDIASLLEEAFGQVSPNRSVSKDYFNSLSKIVIDHNKSILLDSYIEVNGLKILTAIASFSPESAINSNCSGRILFPDDECGEQPLKGDCSDAIVVFKRGKVTFARKAYNAQLSNARAVLIVQDSTSKWPFVMTDSSNELSSLGKLIIPVAMISEKDGLLIKDMYSRLKNKGNTQLTAALTVGTFVSECIICREDYEVGGIVVKLSCRHLYHHDCLHSWVERNNTCPMCRQEMPTASESLRDL